MLPRRLHRRRSGAVIPLVALALVGLAGMMAFAIDLGLIMVAKTQAQNAADLAAMVAARRLDSSASGNTTNATSTAQDYVKANTVLGTALTSSELTISYGAYHYDTTADTFTPQFPPTSPDKYSLVLATVTPNRASLGFSQVFGVSAYNVSAVALAAHRPRDIGLILDYSGSMNDESNLWIQDDTKGTANNDTSNNADDVFPQFGPYDTTLSPLAKMQTTSTDNRVGRSNIGDAALGINAMVGDFYQNARGASAVAAFSAAPSSVTNTAPGGDTYLPKKNSTTTALVWSEITDGSSTASPTTQFLGYNLHTSYVSAAKTFQGWTQGPGYWGKTFFIWPPDPNTPSDVVGSVVPGDWRKRFFYLSDGTTRLNDNTKLFNAAGGLNTPSGNYVINYKAILKWIKANCVQAAAGDGKPFPPTLRAGNILYYSSIPDDVPTAAYNHSNLNASITWASNDQHFWKEYIDYVLGVWRDPLNVVHQPSDYATGMGGDFKAGTSTDGNGVIHGPDAKYPSSATAAFVHPQDSPRRPRHCFWFGPMTMVQYLMDLSMLPGTAHDISMYSAKIGIYGALNDIQNNHPNDLVSLLMYNRPQINTNGTGGNADPSGIGCFSSAQVSLTNDFTKLNNALYYPPNSGTADVSPYDVNGAQTPSAGYNYTFNTATGYGFMLAYNQYSGASYSGTLGGYGRQGASKLLILETDGMANVAVGANFTKSVTSGVNNSYWQIGPSDSVWQDAPTALYGAPTFTSSQSGVYGTAYTRGGQGALNMAARLCALTTDNTNGPGFATSTKPVLIHCLAFGAIFENVTSPRTPAPEQADAMSLCKKIATIGGTGFPSSVSSTSDANFYKLITGDQTSRQNNMRKAFIDIMDSDIPISLIK